MSNFDLRKYLAENKLVTEDKIDMINKYAQRIATGEEIQDEFFMDNKEEILQAADEIEKYMNSDIDIEESNIEEGWKEWALGGLMSLATLVGIGNVYIPKIDQLDSKDKIELTQNAYADALRKMSEEDVDSVYRQVAQSDIKDDLQQNEFTFTDRTTKATIDAAWPAMQQALLRTAIARNIDRFVISKDGNVVFISNPGGITAIKENKPTTKMKKSELKEMIRAAFIAEETNAQYFYEPMEEAEEDEEYDYDDYDLNVEFKKSPNEASYKDVLDIIKSYEDEIILDDFKSEFPKGEPISKKDYSNFSTTLIDDMSEVGFIQANWISIFDEDVFDKAGLVEGEDKEESLDDILSRISGTSVDPYMAEAEEKEETAEEILARITGTKVDPYLAEAKDEEEEMDITVDAEEETTDGGEGKLANDSIVVDKKIVSLSSLPQQTRKILDSLETLRAQAEEFGDQKFITQVGNTITFFTRDFVVAGDEPTKAKVDESLEILKMKKLAGLLTEGEYAKALLREIGMEASFLPVDPVPGSAELTSNIFNSIKNKLMASGEKVINKVPKDELMAMKSAAEKVLGPGFGKEDITMDNAEKVGKVLMSRLNEGNIADTIGGILALVGMGAGIFGVRSNNIPVAVVGLVAIVLGYIIGQTFGDPNDISIDRGI